MHHTPELQVTEVPNNRKLRKGSIKEEKRRMTEWLKKREKGRLKQGYRAFKYSEKQLSSPDVLKRD